MGALKVQDEKKGIKIKIMGTYRDPTKMDQNTPSSNPLNSRIHHHHHNSTPPPRCRLPSISEKQEDTIEISEHLLMNIVSVTGVVLENNTNCSSVHVGDSCFVYPVKNLRCLEYINVTDLESLFIFSEAPYSRVALLPRYGFSSMNVVESLSKYNSNSKIFILGDHNYVWWILKLLRAYEMQECKPHRENIIVATSRDNDLSMIKTDFPDVQVIQWNDDAYEEILIDRTHEAVKGPADVVVNCQTNIRHLNRLFKVCKTDGDIIVGSSLSAFAQKKIFKESRKIVYCNQTENEMDPENVYLQSERICDLVSNMKLESSRVI
ncbi:uncharacterized protein Drat [Lepeophtheirus salmonis]|nr:uncharacterized protein LOC121127516 [Lepeophtheirus salmonis]XP_040578844.1 uncharacterized protein LOC121127516 [Lepeophtheirus salmonis]XP_040578845.1 uncharacterized protein LOC121127516 [Lepeophtheirus salmonis]XP_040578846.1 uncharacterized protein LOC121127516 [Lepeophtheirus salmonis]